VIHGGAGDDVILGGPGVATRLATTTIALTGYGSVVDGIGAQAQILVNGKPVSGLFEFKPATDPSGYQTFTVSFDNPDPVTSVDIELANATPGRALHIKDFSINGVALAPGDATNASSPGSFDLYVHTIHVDTSNHQDWFFGASTDNDVIYGGAGNDVIIGGVGNDIIDGGDGIDTAVYSGNMSDYDFSFSGNALVVSDRIAGRDGSDHLTNIELLKFADTTISTSNLAVNQSGLSAGGSVQIQATDSAGNITVETVRHADGSLDVYMSEIAGKDYASEHDVISVAGTTTLIERFFAGGGLAFRQAVNSDGSVDSTDYDAAGDLTQFATRYIDGSFDQFTFNASGFKTGQTIRHADGSRDIYNYDIVGKDYTSQHVLNDSSGHSELIEQFHSDGTLALRQTVGADGVKTLDQYDSAGRTLQETVIQKDGSYLQSSYAPDGALTTETLRHLDGSRDIYNYNIVGKDYTSQHVVNDPSGHSVLIEDFRGDGSLTLKQMVDAGGVRTLDQYDGLGHIIQETVTQKEGSYLQSRYASDGTLTAQTLGHADGWRDIYSYDIVGKNYTSQHVLNDPLGHSLLIEQFHSDGTLALKQTVDASGVKTLDTYLITGEAYSARHDVMDAAGYRLATTLDNNDGSHTMMAYAPGVTLTSTMTNDVMNSAGGDTFVFKQASGHDIINNFMSGDSAGHDIIQIDSTLAADFAHLSVQIVGHDTIIDLGHNASITLTGVVTPLTAHDVLIV